MSEHDHQAAVIEWAGLQLRRYPDLELLYAIPNGGLRDKVTAGKLKAEGVKPDVPDLCLPVPKGQYIGLYIEMKKPGVKSARPSQVRFLQRLNAHGHYAIMAPGVDQAIAILKWYCSGAKPTESKVNG